MRSTNSGSCYCLYLHEPVTAWRLKIFYGYYFFFLKQLNTVKERYLWPEFWKKTKQKSLIFFLLKPLIPTPQSWEQGEVILRELRVGSCEGIGRWVFNVRPCLCWGLSHLWSATSAAGLLQAPSSHPMTWLGWKSGARSAAGRAISALSAGLLAVARAEVTGCVRCRGPRHARLEQSFLSEWKTSERKGSEEIDRNHNFMGVAINRQAKPELQESCAERLLLRVSQGPREDNNQQIGQGRGEKCLNCCSDLSV